MTEIDNILSYFWNNESLAKNYEQKTGISKICALNYDKFSFIGSLLDNKEIRVVC